jgi:hypothetical protein
MRIEDNRLPHAKFSFSSKTSHKKLKKGHFKEKQAPPRRVNPN